MTIFVTFDENSMVSGFWISEAYGQRGERNLPVYRDVPIYEMVPTIEDVPIYEKVPIFGDVPDATDDNAIPVAPVIGEEERIVGHEARVTGEERRIVGYEKEIIGSEPNPDCIIPAEAVEITQEQYDDLYVNQGRRKFIDGEVVAYEPPLSPPVIPMSASKLGLIRAFKEQGAWHSVKAMIAADEDVQEEWEAATEIRRADPITQGMVAAMKLTEAQVDALLVRANELVA